MKFGASTACFYPLETEKALKKVCELGYKYAEVFMNAPSELEEPFLKQLNTIAKDGGTDIVSVHPFSSFMESSCIFTDYQRRFDDFISIYDKTCHAAAVLGAEYVVIHGAVAHPKIPIRMKDILTGLTSLSKSESVRCNCLPRKCKQI